MTYHQQKGRGYGHVTVLKFCRDAARRAGLSVIAELLVFYSVTRNKRPLQQRSGSFRLSHPQICNMTSPLTWWFRLGVRRTNDVTLRRARLLLGWVTIRGYTVFVRIIRHPGQLSLLPSAGWKISTGLTAVMLCGWGVKAGMTHSSCG